MHFHTVIPAWGDRCVAAARDHVIPSLMSAIQYAGADVRLIVYSDRELSLDGIDGELRELSTAALPHQIGLQGRLRNLHYWTIAEAPPGSVAVLLNADIVVSREFFAFAAEKMRGHCRVIVGTALRTMGEGPPIGAAAHELLGWAWENRHPLAESCVLGRGRSAFPNTVIIDRGENVILHSPHLHPFFIQNDGRDLKFKGTIDDDLLANYADDEIAFVSDGEIGFAELSPPQGFGLGDIIDENTVSRFARRCGWIPAHIRNFRTGIRLRGFDECIDASIETIADKAARWHNR